MQHSAEKLYLCPKQFVDALGVGKTFIQLTYERFARLIPKENFLVMTGEGYKDLVLEQLPMLRPEQVLTEPCRRNTAPCIAYAMTKLYRRDPHAVAAKARANATRHDNTIIILIHAKSIL